MKQARKVSLYLVMLAILVLASVSSAVANSIIGVSSSQSPYLVRSQPGVVIKSILSAGDAVPGVNGAAYRLTGLPDGLGAFDNGDGTFTLLMNHEMGNTSGVIRAHGARGAFVSKWIINQDDLRVLYGQDLIQQVVTWNPLANGYNAPAQGVAFARFCSADLPALSAFYEDDNGLGYNGRLYLNGEENGTEGRAFAHAMDGTSYELPRLGKFSWENSVAHPSTGAKTVVVGLDDSGSGQIYVYVGDKTNTGSPVDLAGLTNGTLYGVKVDGLAKETDQTALTSASFSLYSFGNVANTTGAQLETLSNTNGVTAFNRPEDGAWNPADTQDFYFVTTASFTGKSRLWKLHFDDIENPADGGTVEMLLDGSEGQHMLDNMTINERGQVLIQEDPGNQAYLARIWRYSIANDTLTQVAQHDPQRFAVGAAGFLTQDEESSGIIDASEILGEGWYLLDVQAHYNFGDPAIVEGAQLLALHIPPGRK